MYFGFNNNSGHGSSLLDLLIVLGFALGIASFVWNMATPTPTSTIQATVIETEEKTLEHYQKGGNSFTHHCYVYVVEKGKKEHSIIQFPTENAAEAKVYCDAVQKNTTYKFTILYDRNEIKTASKYSFIEKQTP